MSGESMRPIKAYAVVDSRGVAELRYDVFMNLGKARDRLRWREEKYAYRPYRIQKVVITPINEPESA